MQRHKKKLKKKHKKNKEKKYSRSIEYLIFRYEKTKIIYKRKRLSHKR